MGNIQEIVAVTRALRIISMAGNEAFVQGGVSLGVRFSKGHVKLLVNLAASKAEGMKLRADLMRVAAIIR